MLIMAEEEELELNRSQENVGQDPTTVNDDIIPPPQPPPAVKAKVKLLKCRDCGEMIPKVKSLALLHVTKTCPELKELKKKGSQPIPPWSKSKARLKNGKNKSGRGRPPKNAPRRRRRPPEPPKEAQIKVEQPPKPPRPPARVRVMMAPAPILLHPHHGQLTVPYSALRCPVCRSRFGTLTKAREHLHTHSESRPWKLAQLRTLLPHPCSRGVTCSRSFSTPFFRDHHELGHTRRWKVIRKRAFRRWRSFLGRREFKKRWRIDMRKRNFSCAKCGQGFRKFSQFTKHLRQFSGRWCDGRRRKCLKSRRRSREHGSRLKALITTFLTPMPCPDPGCEGALFASRLHLRYHTRKEHKKEEVVAKRGGYVRKVYTCDICNHPPPTPPVLKNGDIKNIKKYTKGRRFKTENGVKCHRQMLHDPTPCPSCPEILQGLLGLKRHSSRSHPKPEATDDNSILENKSLIPEPRPRLSVTLRERRPKRKAHSKVGEGQSRSNPKRLRRSGGSRNKTMKKMGNGDETSGSEESWQSSSSEDEGGRVSRGTSRRKGQVHQGQGDKSGLRSIPKKLVQSRWKGDSETDDSSCEEGSNPWEEDESGAIIGWKNNPQHKIKEEIISDEEQGLEDSLDFGDGYHCDQMIKEELNLSYSQEGDDEDPDGSGLEEGHFEFEDVDVEPFQQITHQIKDELPDAEDSEDVLGYVQTEGRQDDASTICSHSDRVETNIETEGLVATSTTSLPSDFIVGI